MPVHLNSNISEPNSGPSASSDAADHPVDLWKITRRSFIAACLAGCSQAVLPSAETKRPERRGETWALLSDVHISAKPERRFGRACMTENLRQAVDEIVDLRPDQLLFNGDIGYMRGRADDYAAFLKLTDPLRDRRMPTHLTLGNHDHRQRFMQALSVENDSAVAEKAVSIRRINNRQWLFLDSLERTQAIRGSLGQSQLAWLQERLDADPTTPTIVCLHHNPDHSPVGLKDYDEFQKLVLPRRQVKLVLFGHTHIFRMWETDGLHFVNLPALGFRLQPGTSLGWMSANFEPDGARLVFRGIDRKQKDDGTVKELRWRNLA